MILAKSSDRMMLYSNDFRRMGSSSYGSLLLTAVAQVLSGERQKLREMGISY